MVVEFRGAGGEPFAQQREADERDGGEDRAWSPLPLHDGAGPRGRLDGGPETGYPPTDVASWLRILRVADVRGVPFFLKGRVRGEFPQEPESWVLMDWKGKFALAYEWLPDTSNVSLFDRDSILIHQDSGKDPEAGTIPDIVILLQDALQTPAQP